MEARLTQYCEAYLTSNDLCVPGRLCCVSKDGYGDKSPSDLVVPNEKKHATKRPTTAVSISCHQHLNIASSIALANVTVFVPHSECIWFVQQLFCSYYVYFALLYFLNMFHIFQQS